MRPTTGRLHCIPGSQREHCYARYDFVGVIVLILERVHVREAHDFKSVLFGASKINQTTPVIVVFPIIPNV